MKEHGITEDPPNPHKRTGQPSGLGEYRRDGQQQTEEAPSLPKAEKKELKKK